MIGSYNRAKELGLNISLVVLDLALVCTLLMEVSPIPAIWRQGWCLMCIGIFLVPDPQNHRIIES